MNWKDLLPGYAQYAQLNRIEAALGALTRSMEANRMTLQEILDKVTATRGQVQSMAVLLGEVAQLVRDNVGDPAKLQAIADQIDSIAADATAAIDANKDVDPTP